MTLKTTLLHKHIVIMGLGLHGGGLASARFFARMGASVIVTDTKTKAELAPSIKKLARYKNIKYVLGKHRETDFASADLIIRNPAVPNDSPFLQIARSHNIPVHTDVSWFLSLVLNPSQPPPPARLVQARRAGLRNGRSAPERPIIIGITGTKGKSTTSALLHRVLAKAGKNAILAGNIRKSPLDFIKIRNESLVIGHCLPASPCEAWRAGSLAILELSSWHIESLHEHKLSPSIALITNILPDHLNRYATFQSYAKTKFLIHGNQSKNDVLFINKNDRVSQECAKKEKRAKIIMFSEKTIKNTRAWSLHPVAIGATLAIARYLKIQEKLAEEAIAEFPGLEGRLEYAGKIKGVRYYNDTCATQPDAAQFAIEKITNYELRITNSKNKARVILIAGGRDKNLNYKKLADTIARSVHILILFKGSASDKLAKNLLHYGSKTPRMHQNIASMKDAVALAKKYARSGDVVLLSPGAASFGLFRHEFDRGKQFMNEIV